MHAAEVDLHYTQYYPLTEAYISLFSQDRDAGDEDNVDEKETSSKPPIWAEVEKAMEEGTLDQLRNRAGKAMTLPSKKVLKRRVTSNPPPAPEDLVGLNRRERRARYVQPFRKAGKQSLPLARMDQEDVVETMENDGRGADDDPQGYGGFFEE